MHPHIQDLLIIMTMATIDCRRGLHSPRPTASRINGLFNDRWYLSRLDERTFEGAVRFFARRGCPVGFDKLNGAEKMYGI
jgi:hypothetical protein